MLTNHAIQSLPRLKKLWVDGGYGGEVYLTDIRQQTGLTLEVVERDPTQPFHVIPWRWVVERTLSWWGNYRRLSKEYEYQVNSTESMCYLAMLHLMTRRLAALSPST